MHVRACVAVVLMSVAVLAGCGGATKTVTVTPKPTTTRVKGTTPSGATTTAAVSSPPLATRVSTMNGDPVMLSIDSLTRVGATVELTISLTTNATDRPCVCQTFDDGEYEKITSPGATDISGGSTLDGIYLVDNTDAKKYPVARDSYNQCVCDTNLLGTYVYQGAPLFLSATFGAPPGYVKAVNVFIPHYGTFVNVPIT